MKLGLCLSGGGIKGAAHIGVLKAFEEKGIKIDMISGASSGSIVASLFALGYSNEEIYTFFKKYAKDIKYVDIKNIFKLVAGLITTSKITITGLTAGKNLEKLMEKKCKEKNITNVDEVVLPLFISSVNLESGNTYIFTNRKCVYDYRLKVIQKIPLSKAVRASCSFPGIFEPEQWNGYQFIDGGVRENIPWKVLKNCGADKIISVVFSNSSKKDCSKNMFQVIDCSFQYLNRELFEYEMIGSGDVIEIATENINLLDYTKVDYLYQLGYKKAKKYLESIKDS